MKGKEGRIDKKGDNLPRSERLLRNRRKAPEEEQGGSSGFQLRLLLLSFCFTFSP